MQCPADTCVKVKVTTFSIEPGLDFLNLYNGESKTVGARPGWLRALNMFRSISVLCGAFVWARRALNSPFWRFSARAVAKAHGLAAVRLAGQRRYRHGARRVTVPRVRERQGGAGEKITP